VQIGIFSFTKFHFKIITFWIKTTEIARTATTFLARGFLK